MHRHDDFVHIVEVGPRDGLQNLPASMQLSEKQSIKLIEKLAACQIPSIEIGSFVSPKYVPQMKHSAAMTRYFQKQRDQILLDQNSLRKDRMASAPDSSKPDYIVLTPNIRGFDDALLAGAQHIAIFISASNSFSEKNVRMDMYKSLDTATEIIHRAKQENIRVRGYISCVFGCPFEGSVDLGISVDFAQRLLAVGCDAISFGDTIGVANPHQVKQLALSLGLENIKSMSASPLFALHMHQTYGQALVNIYAGLEAGFRMFDSSIAGLGGCPFAPGATGNIATEDLLFLLNGLGMETGIQMENLLEVSHFVRDELNLPITSNVANAQKHT